MEMEGGEEKILEPFFFILLYIIKRTNQTIKIINK